MIRWLLLLLLFAPASVSALDAMVHDAWVRQPPPGANAAAYLTIHNTGAEPLRVVAVESDAAERVTLHRSVVEDGVARMIPVDAIDVPAGGRVELAPGGLHVMLIRPRPLRPDDEVPLRLRLEGGETLDATAVVRKAAGGHHEGHHP